MRFAAFFAWRAPRERPGDGAVEIGLRCLRTPRGSSASRSRSRRSRDAPDFAHSVPYPVAVKRLDVEHKTEVGGVALDVADHEELHEAARRMGQQRVLVQRMEPGLAEAIVGYRDDPVVGPIVLVGAGGTLAELYQRLRVAHRAGQRRRGPGNDREGEGPRGDPRLSQPAARRCRRAGASGRGVSRLAYGAAGSRRRRSIR